MANGGPENFASFIGSAMKPPEPPTGGGTELPDGFPAPKLPGVRVVHDEGEGISGVVAYDYKVHRRVFLIFQPYGQCTRCMSDIGNGVEVLPATGAFTCPHTDLVEYEEIVNDALSGKTIFGGETETVQKDGSVIISLRWYEQFKRAEKKGGASTLPKP